MLVASVRCAIRCYQIEGFINLCYGGYVQSVFSVKVYFENKWKGITLGQNQILCSVSWKKYLTFLELILNRFEICYANFVLYELSYTCTCTSNYHNSFAISITLQTGNVSLYFTIQIEENMSDKVIFMQ